MCPCVTVLCGQEADRVILWWTGSRMIKDKLKMSLDALPRYNTPCKEGKVNRVDEDRSPF